MSEKILKFTGVYLRALEANEGKFLVICQFQGLHSFGLSYASNTVSKGFYKADLTYDIETKSYSIDLIAECKEPTISEVAISGSQVATILRAKGFYQAIKISPMFGVFEFSQMNN